MSLLLQLPDSVGKCVLEWIPRDLGCLDIAMSNKAMRKDFLRVLSGTRLFSCLACTSSLSLWVQARLVMLTDVCVSADNCWVDNLDPSHILRVDLSDIDLRDVNAYLVSCVNLKSLDICYATELNSLDCQVLRRLEYLYIGCDSDRNLVDLVANIRSHCHRLVSLSVYRNLGDIVDVLKNNSNLQALAVSGNQSILDSVLLYSPNIKKFRLTVESNATLDFLSVMKFLSCKPDIQECLISARMGTLNYRNANKCRSLFIGHDLIDFQDILSEALLIDGVTDFVLHECNVGDSTLVSSFIFRCLSHWSNTLTGVELSVTDVLILKEILHQHTNITELRLRSGIDSQNVIFLLKGCGKHVKVLNLQLFNHSFSGYERLSHDDVMSVLTECNQLKKAEISFRIEPEEVETWNTCNQLSVTHVELIILQLEYCENNRHKSIKLQYCQGVRSTESRGRNTMFK